MITNEDLILERWTYVAKILYGSFSSLLDHFNNRNTGAERMSIKIKSSMEKFVFYETMSLSDILIEYIQVAKSECELFLNFGRYLMILDSEKCRMKLHIKFLSKENSWLKNEIKDLHQLLIKLEKRCVKAEAEKKYLQCYYNMRNYSKSYATDMFPVPVVFADDDEDSEPDEDVPISLSPLYHLVSHFITDNKYLVATIWCNKNVTDYTEKYGEKSQEVGSVYNLLGRIYKSYRSYPLAKDYFLSSLAIREKLYGKDSDQVAITLTLLGSTMGKLKNFQKALELCKRAILIRERIYGRNNEVAHLYAKVGNFSFELKIWNDVILNYKICLSVFEVIYDQTDMSIIKAYTILSHAYIHINLTDKALEYLNKVNLGYIQKNNPGSLRRNTPMSVIEESLKRNVQTFAAEMLLQRFGTILETLDDRVVEVMSFYYEKMNKPEIVDMLRCWVYLSNGDLNISEDVLANVNKPTRRLSDIPSISLQTNMPEPARKDSFSASFRNSVRSMFALKN